MIDYSPFYETIKSKGETTYSLIQKGIDRRLLSMIKNNRSVTVYSLERICRVLDCRVEDILTFHFERDENGNIIN